MTVEYDISEWLLMIDLNIPSTIKNPNSVKNKLLDLQKAIHKAFQKNDHLLYQLRHLNIHIVGSQISPLNTNVEPMEWVITFDLDVPTQREKSREVQDCLNALKWQAFGEIIPSRAWGPNQIVQQLNDLGVTIETDIRVEKRET